MEITAVTSLHPICNQSQWWVNAAVMLNETKPLRPRFRPEDRPRPKFGPRDRHQKNFWSSDQFGVETSAYQE